jgi:signal transduction histidine kinase
VAWDNTVLHDAAGRVTGTASVGHDVTERVRVARLKSELLAVASHELRSPITAIRGALDLLNHARRSGAPASDARASAEARLLDIAARNAKRLGLLVNDLLDLERLEAGAEVLRPARVGMDALLGAAIESVAPIAESAGVVLRVDTGAADRTLQAWADASRITQVLANLLGNAIKFTPSGRTVTLAVDADPLAPRTLRVTVRDEGRGVPPEKLAAIFEPFAQVEAGDHREKGGAGLGLAICRTIVRQHGGRIWAESPGMGGGTVVTFTLAAAEPV